MSKAVVKKAGSMVGGSNMEDELSTTEPRDVGETSITADEKKLPEVGGR